MAEDESAADASARRRTGLAGERTLLAWWRTGLTAIAVALGVGRLLPELAQESTRWPYALLGSAFALYGVAMLVYGTRRMNLPGSRGRGELALFSIAGVLLGLGTMVLIIAQ